MSLQRTPADKATELRLVPVGAAPARLVPEQRQGTANDLRGSDPAAWRTGIPTYGKVSAVGLYPGIDVTYYGNQRQLEYDYVIAAGATPDPIRFRVVGADALSVDEGGHLVAATPVGSVVQQRPIAYQPVGGDRRPVAAEFVLFGPDEVGFRLGAYDRRSVLVIDPVLAYSTFLGGMYVEGGTGIAVDRQGNAYVTGSTNSSDFPTTAGADATLAGEDDVFVTKLDATGSRIVYSTLLGGRSYDSASAIAVDAAGRAHVVGVTDSSDFPATSELGTPGWNKRGFIAKLDPNGSSLLYSTVVVGAWMNDLALDAAGVAHVGGSAFSDMPIVAGMDSTHNGGELDGFIARFGAEGSLLYSTFLGGTDWDGIDAIAVDDTGAAYVAGSTYSVDFPTVAAFDAEHNGGYNDAFVAKLQADGSALVYSTYLGGPGSDYARGITVDASGGAYVTGFAGPGGFPTTPGAFDTSYNGGPPWSGGGDAFVTKLSADGRSLVFSTFIGGNGDEQGTAIALDAAGRAYLSGLAFYTDDFPIVGGFQAELKGINDPWVAVLRADGRRLDYSTFFGGELGEEDAWDIALGPDESIHVVGTTYSPDFPTKNPYDATLDSNDAFVVKIHPVPSRRPQSPAAPGVP